MKQDETLREAWLKRSRIIGTPSTTLRSDRAGQCCTKSADPWIGAATVDLSYILVLVVDRCPGMWGLHTYL